MRFIYSLMAALMLLSGQSAAQTQPVVVELYTSQGCSSCPPADAYLHKLAARDDVIALALHVDYWDYIGWKDSFANPAWTTRQRKYASAAGRRMVYTPQMIINGADHVVGNRPMDVEDLIDRHHAQPVKMQLRATREGNRLTIAATPNHDVAGPLLVQVIRYRPKEKVAIKRGENAGRTLSYANIVTEIAAVKTWTGRKALELEADIAGDQPGVIVIQQKGHGAIVAAARID